MNERSVSWVDNYGSTSFKVKWKVISVQAHRGGVYCQGQSKVTEGKGVFFTLFAIHVPYNKVAGLLYGMTVILTPGVSALKSPPQQEWGHFSH